MKFLSTAACCFEDSGGSEKETLIISSLCLWWESMIGATLLDHSDALCTAVKDISSELKGDRQLLRSRIKSGLNDKVCVCVHVWCEHACVSVHEYVCVCVCGCVELWVCVCVWVYMGVGMCVCI